MVMRVHSPCCIVANEQSLVKTVQFVQNVSYMKPELHALPLKIECEDPKKKVTHPDGPV